MKRAQLPLFHPVGKISRQIKFDAKPMPKQFEQARKLNIG